MVTAARIHIHAPQRPIRCEVITQGPAGRSVKVQLQPLGHPRDQRKLTSRAMEWLREERGYHGTSMGQLREQLNTGRFENVGKPIYFDRQEVAASYALSKASQDGTDPVVLKVASVGKSEMNNWKTEGWGFGGKAPFSYFNPDRGEVKIRQAFLVKPEEKL